jgi:protein phosphatase
MGQVRGNNEDSIFYLVPGEASIPMGLFIVADGVGGHLAGELASGWAVSAARDALRDLFAPQGKSQTHPLDPKRAPPVGSADDTLNAKRMYSMSERILRAAQSANRAVYANAQQQPDEAGNASTTLTMALVRGERVFVANVGDSRTYLLRGDEIRQITTDHSLIAGLVRSGNVKPEELYTHPARNVIVRSLGTAPEVDVDLFEEQLQAGDTLLLCSDGLWEMVRGSDRIGEIVRRAETPMQACRDLIEAANQAGGQDNISVIVVWVESM